VTAPQEAVRWELGDDGIAVVTLDDPAHSANTMNDAYLAGMEHVLDGLAAARGDLRGVIVTSAKKTFFAGGDLEWLSSQGPDDAAAVFEQVTRTKDQLRRLETLGVPVVAAITGTALGGGLEIALACHHRIALDGPGVVYGLPEVTLGLLPGAGGITRITRMLGIADGFMKVLVKGQRHKPAAALEIGIVDELVASGDEAMERARAWIAEQGGRGEDAARQPWDTPGYKIPGGTPSSPKLAAFLRTCASSSRAPRCRHPAASSPPPSRAPRSTSTPRCASRAATSSSWSPARCRRT
jgi:3-hydroxyacyl-CoA dehydrogenase / enoyl-CoA hydratase / 3-hydroxybutyryl-CoA epimerase